ncbi:tripartite tricarboxylate transporter substrate binding protein [Rhodoferax sp. BAB1]|uniref:Bug family tripartite tricarboxylate transporter substrate binding protein n=1 Tax=Rhodoferax sp. BAB1 TaxID=2741720 RepID=UPI001575ECEB|nr:tripartite tricarboxylate transporter substrate binding protein [Rhodoferax sp. BAB1]QKO21598.1 tripartite tricarboxylate transporter substrate binding protein [Rhodoferax sp. BAB1]
MTLKTNFRRLFLASVLGLSAFGAAAQNYPNRPVKIIVPFGAGGFTDVVARIVGQKLGAAMGGSFVIENKPGAGSTIGADMVAKAAPDGYTLVMISSTHTISPSIYKSIPYDPIKSFTPISKLVDSAYVLVVNPNKVAATNVKDFIALAKAKPDVLHYASSGNGSTQHLMGGLFVSMTGAQLKHVPYRGSNGAMTDLIAGVVDSSFAGITNALPHLATGKLKALAVTTATRAPQMPDVPTLQEAGVAGYDASNWLALLGPAGMPKEIVQRLNSEIAKLMAQPDTQKALFDAGVQVGLSTPEGLTQLMQGDMVKWAKIVKDAGIEIQ